MNRFKFTTIAMGLLIASAAQSQQRVTSQSELSAIAAKTPQAPVKAQVYFNNTMPLDALPQRVARWQVQPRSFRMEGSTIQGEHRLAPGQSMDEAIAAQKEGHDAFIEVLRKEGNTELIKEVEEARKRVVAVDVIGSAEAVSALMASEKDLKIEDPHNPPPRNGPRASETEPEFAPGCKSIGDKECASPFEPSTKE